MIVSRWEHLSRICKNSTSQSAAHVARQHSNGSTEETQHSSSSRWPEQCDILTEIAAAQPCVQVSGKMLNRSPCGATRHPDRGVHAFARFHISTTPQRPFYSNARNNRDQNCKTLFRERSSPGVALRITTIESNWYMRRYVMVVPKVPVA
jgi:hypothetical protein